MISDISLGNLKVGPGHRPFIIAEMSGNHNQSLEQALRIVDAAAEAGVQALKIQTYTADTMTLPLKKNEFFISDPKSLWKGKSLHDLYKEAATPYEWHKSIFERCKMKGVLGFSTPFDLSSVEFLETLNVPFYKIASFEIVDLPLIKKVAGTGKPLIMSTGMATIGEIEEAVNTARTNGCSEIVLLKCTSSYPASPTDTNLKTIPHMQNLFNTQVGLSDHTMGIGVPIAAISLGATVVEKHFTLRRSDGGVDSAFSLEPEEMKSLVVESERAWQALGWISYGPLKNEEASLQFRRSIYISEDLSAGDILSEKNMRIIRPGFGLAPKYFDFLLGKKVSRSVERGTPASWDIL